MRSFVAFFKKELTGTYRGGKLWLLGALFLFFGLMNPIISLATPMLFDILSESLASSGLQLIAPAADAMNAWLQFFKNVPMALIAFVLITGNAFTKEYGKGTLLLMVTRGLARYKIVLAKSVNLLLLWTGGYALCFLVTFGCNAILFTDGVPSGLFPSVLYFWLFGVLVVALCVFFSTLFSNYGLVLLGTGGCALVSYLIELLPRIGRFFPTSLMNGSAVILGITAYERLLPAALIAIVLSVALIVSSIPVLNKKEL